MPPCGRTGCCRSRRTPGPVDEPNAEAPALVDPQPRWAVDARRLAARISRAAGGARVDHIGSTAIPGMPAKDVIDLQLTVPSLDAADELAPALAAAGFPGRSGSSGTPHIRPATTRPAG